MFDIIIEYNVVTCPFGHDQPHAARVEDKTYNEARLWPSREQDIKFIEDVKPDDIVVIPLKKKRRAIVGIIVSDPVRFMEPVLYEIRDASGNYTGLTREINGVPFNPWVRHIKVIGILEDESCKGYMKSLQRINSSSPLHDKVMQFILQHGQDN